MEAVTQGAVIGMKVMLYFLLLLRLHKLPSQCYSTWPSNLGNLDSNKEIKPAGFLKYTIIWKKARQSLVEMLIFYNL